MKKNAQTETIFLLVATEILMGENETPIKLYANGDGKELLFVVDYGNGKHKYYKSSKRPSELNDQERFDVLSYCLASFDEEEEVSYKDLFLQGGFITEIAMPVGYVYKLINKLF